MGVEIGRMWKMFSRALEQQLTSDFRCIVARWLDGLTVEDQQMVQEAIEKHGVFVTWKACKNYSYGGSESAFYRHWKGDCPCSTKN